MRSRVVAVVLVALLALTAIALGGCGGGAKKEPTTTTSTTPPVTTPPPSGSTAAAPPADLSPEEPASYEPFPTNPAVTPKAVLDLIESRQPMIVYFYDSTQKTTDDEAKGVDAKGGLEKLMSDYRGAIDLVSFDVANMVTTNSDGTISFDPALASDAAAQQTAALATQVGVNFTPYIIIVDADGYVLARFRGWDDYKDIEREVLRATG